MKTILITGASRGIGAETAKLFAKNGYNVLINYNRSEKQALALKEELKDFSVEIFKADVSKEDDVKQLVEFTLKRFGKIDVLFNNAGIDRQSLAIDDDEKAYYTVFDTNFKSIFNCTRFVLPGMISNKYGKIINNASVWGVVGASYESLYSASKGAVIAYTKALSKEYGPSNININAIAPGYVETKMNEWVCEKDKQDIINSTSLERTASPSEIAQLVLFLADDKSSFVTGQTIVIDGGSIDV